MAGKKTDKKDAPNQNQGPENAKPLSCTFQTCKKDVARFGFCSEHFRQYKFGLINKSGAPVPDYEKKLEHYNAHQEKQSAQKVA